MSVDLNAFTCGRRFEPGSTASIAARFRSNVATSTSNAGVIRASVLDGSARHPPILADLPEVALDRDAQRADPGVFGNWGGVGGGGTVSVVQLDLDFVRSNFPAFARPINDGQSFFENAGGSFACRQTIDALTEYYTDLKVQPYSEFESSRRAGELMDRSRERWAEALGVEGPRDRVRAVDDGEHLRARPCLRRRARTGQRGDRHQPGSRGQHRRHPAGRRAGRLRGQGVADRSRHRPARHRRLRGTAQRTHRTRHGAACLEHRRIRERRHPHHATRTRSRRPGDRRRGVVRPALAARRRGDRRRRVPVQPLQDLLGAPGSDGGAGRADGRASRTRATSSTTT